MEPSASRLKMARRMGATHTIDPVAIEKQGGQVKDVILEATGGEGVSVAVEASGVGERVYPIFEEVLTPNGKIIQAGMGGKRVPISVLKMQWRQLHVHGSVGHAGSGIFPSVIKLMASKRIDLTPLVTARFPLEQSIEAIQQAEKLNDVKVLVKQ
jgi:threonine dehydrogenase-like Zn-dependent dehydrogenase